MDTEAFKSAYNNSYRNGTDGFHFNPLYRTFRYSDGVKECADAGCHWLLDILGTELPEVFRQHPDDSLMIVEVGVADGKARITGSFRDGQTDYVHRIDWTDMPDGRWTFYVSSEEGCLVCILPSEY